jgi:hypothetical protein
MKWVPWRAVLVPSPPRSTYNLQNFVYFLYDTLYDVLRFVIHTSGTHYGEEVNVVSLIGCI